MVKYTFILRVIYSLIVTNQKDDVANVSHVEAEVYLHWITIECLLTRKWFVSISR